MTTLNDVMEFDHVIQVDEFGTVTDAPGLYAPEVYVICDSDGQMIDGPHIGGRGSWEFMDGYSGQDRYSGPIMHASEFIGGRMERDILATPGTYVVVVVVDPDDLDDPVGWAVLRRTTNLEDN